MEAWAGFPSAERTSIVIMIRKLRINALKMVFLPGILSKKRSRKKLTHKEINRPPTSAEARAAGSEDIKKAALYFAAMGDTEITKSTVQKARPPAAANINSRFENLWDALGSLCVVTRVSMAVSLFQPGRFHCKYGWMVALVLSFIHIAYRYSKSKDPDHIKHCADGEVPQDIICCIKT